MEKERLVRHPLRFRMAQVRRVTPLTPRMVRITLGGAELADFITLSPDDHVKLFFPPEGEEKPALPVPGPEGLIWPEGQPRSIARDYTPCRYDSEACELDFDFVLHGEGVASGWAAQAKEGQWLGVGGPRGSHLATYDADWYLLAGDESALPSLARRLAELPRDARVFAFFEVADAREVQPLNAPEGATITWRFRADATEVGQAPLETAVRELPFPPGELKAWVQGEATAVRAIYRYLLHEKGANREFIHANGYWKRGTVNHDHHEPIEA